MLTSASGAPRVAVVGSVFLDLIYDQRFDHKGIQPVRSFHGGIGRNVSENLGWIGLQPTLITLMTPDDLGGRIAAELARAGVDLAIKYANPGIGIYRAFVRDGETVQYRIEQPLIDELDWDFVSSRLPAVSHVVVEAGLDQDMMCKLLAHCRTHGIQSFGIPTRLHELPVDGALDIISRLDCVIMNRPEAEIITRRRIVSHDIAAQAAVELQQKGVKQVVITLGAEGAVAANCGSAPAMYAAGAAKIVSTLGCGDAFTAGLVAASAAGCAFPAAIDTAFKLARRTAEAPGAVHPGAGVGLLAAFQTAGARDETSQHKNIGPENIYA